jgi:hypothetical protein
MNVFKTSRDQQQSKQLQAFDQASAMAYNEAHSKYDTHNVNCE